MPRPESPALAQTGEPHAAEHFAGILATIWRRRFALVVPLLIMLPLSFAAAFIVPQRYVARALILFQESDPENPLVSRNSQVSDRMQDKIAGMRALIKSENVLSKVVDELSGGQALHSVERASRILRLQTALEVDNVGNNLLEFRFSGSRAAGLGAELDTIIKHFLDGYRSASPYRTPERIVAIDRPSDPTRPVRGKMIVLILGMVAGIAMGIALAALLEYLDTRVRTRREFERIVGAPVVARLSSINAQAAPGPEPMPR